MRVLVVDDHPLARAALRKLLARLPGWVVVGEADDGDEAIRAVDRLKPDLVLMDLTMPRCDGLLATRAIRRRHPQVRVVILTVHRNPEQFWEAIRCGAQGYLTKSLDPATLLASLQELITDEQPISRQTARTLLDAIKPVSRQPTGFGAVQAVLTEREWQVATLVSRGLTNREIARHLLVSEHTVHNHLKRILAKTGARNRADLARQVATGQIDGPDVAISPPYQVP